ncbi:hypothetical protein SAY87_024566 [Trapa incisa]|uniref:non-specific serine/threonine protein kinase n=1 Tax=Trapa incisa TaxID=236973 RepID=A0AAN7JG10_9MYRT|nr:hypothetical protein SAY87_024566 [Trapa incisa]
MGRLRLRRTVVLTPTHLAIVMEYAAGGELFQKICNAHARRFGEDEQICHRDLKLENTLLDGSPALRLKFCDFDFSKRIMKVQYSIPDYVHISQDCKQLLARIFVANPSKRISIKEIKSHPWFLKNLPRELTEAAQAVYYRKELRGQDQAVEPGIIYHNYQICFSSASMMYL